MSEKFNDWLDWVIKETLDGKKLKDLGDKFHDRFTGLSKDRREMTAFYIFMAMKYPNFIMDFINEDSVAGEIIDICMNTWKARAELADEEVAKLLNNSIFIDLSEKDCVEKAQYDVSILSHMRKAEMTIRENNPDLSDEEIEEILTDYSKQLKKKLTKEEKPK